MNTPKATPRQLQTRSQNPRPVSNKSVRKIDQNSKHHSIKKEKEIVYKPTMNKLLSHTDYSKFIYYASKYVDRRILQCELQPQKNPTIKNISHYLIADGIFVKKLAQLSPNPALVVNHFMKHINVNKKILGDFYSSINKTKDGDEKKEVWSQPLKQIQQTEQQRQFRLLGYSKSKKKNEEEKKERKVYFEEYIKSNRKSQETYLRIQKQYQEINKKEWAQPKRQSLKRNDIYDKYSKEKIVNKITQEVLEGMSPTQKQILKKFPNLQLYIDKSKIKSIVKIDVLGQINGFQVCSVGIQFVDPFFQFNRDQLENRVIIERAIAIQKQQQDNGDVEMKDQPGITILVGEKTIKN